MSEADVAVPGIQGRLTIATPSLLSSARLLVNGAPAKKGKWGKVLLQRADGSTVEAKLVDHLTRTVPSIQIGAEKHEFGEKVPIVLLVLSLLPFGLVGVGGALGGLCGGIGWFVNQRIIRSNQAAALKVGSMFGVTVLAVATYGVLASLFFASVK